MRRSSLHFSLIHIFVTACGLLAGTAIAQAAAETWVSGTGTDSGTCPRTAPCRTFQFAHNQTNNNGAINVLTAGNFGPLTITKPISIVADGVEAVINSGVNAAAIQIDVGGAAVVSLRGLTIDMRGTSNGGIVFTAGAALHVKDCVIRKTGLNGIFFAPSGDSELYIADTMIADAGSSGIQVSPASSGSATVVLDRIRIENSGEHGANFRSLNGGPITATVRDSVSAGNASGFRADVSAGGLASVMLDRVAALNNVDGGSGIIAFGAGATIRVGDSTVMGNTAGLNPASGGVIDSYGTNKVNGNVIDGSPTTPLT